MRIPRFIVPAMWVLFLLNVINWQMSWYYWLFPVVLFIAYIINDEIKERRHVEK